MTDERPAPGVDEPRVLAFVAPWCGPCHRLTPVLEEVATGRTDGVRLELVRVDEEPDAVARHGVRATPTTIAVHGDVEITRVVGGMTSAQVEQVFAAARTPTPSQAPRRRGSPVDLALRIGVAVVLTVAGLVLAQPVLLGAGVVVAGVTAVLARLPRRRSSTTTTTPADAPGPVL